LKEKRFGSWALLRRLTAFAFLGLLYLGSLESVAWFRGTTTATRLLDFVPFGDPLAALEVTLATRELAVDLLLGAGVLVVATLLLGPFFCSWVCPLGLVLDLNQALKNRLVKRWRRYRWMHLSLPRDWRLLVLGLALGFSLVGGLPLFQTVSPINIVAWSLVFGAGLPLLLVGVIAVVEWFAPRLWCRTLCPLGGLYSALGRRALLRIRVAESQVTRRRCRQCTLSCPMDIRVMEEEVVACHSVVGDPDCTRCGACVDACPERVLGFGIESATTDRAS